MHRAAHASRSGRMELNDAGRSGWWMARVRPHSVCRCNMVRLKGTARNAPSRMCHFAGLAERCPARGRLSPWRNLG